MIFYIHNSLPDDIVVDSVILIVVKRVVSNVVVDIYSVFLRTIGMIDVAIIATIINTPRQITIIRSFRLFDLQ
jgi:hypothetical protein